jgi:hypothetical protein
MRGRAGAGARVALHGTVAGVLAIHFAPFDCDWLRFRVVVVSTVGWGGAKALLMAGGKYSVRGFQFWRVSTRAGEMSRHPPFFFETRHPHQATRL